MSVTDMIVLCLYRADFAPAAYIMSLCSGMFTRKYTAYVVQFFQCFERRQIIDIYALDFIAYLTENGVVELEKR